MEESIQTNIPKYFNNLKRHSSESEYKEGKEILSNKRDKKNVSVKIGDFYNKTIGCYFKFTPNKNDDVSKIIRDGIKELEINSKNKVMSSNDFILADKTTGIEKYFLKKPKFNINNINGTNFENHFKNLISYEDNEMVIDSTVFSLDHFEVSNTNTEKKLQQNNFTKSNEAVKPITYLQAKITNYVEYKTFSDLNGIPENLCQNIFKYLPFKDLVRSSMSNKTFLNLFRNFIKSYNGYTYFKSINTKVIGEKDFPKKFRDTKQEFFDTLKKAKNLKHIEKLNWIIKNDFGGEKNGPDNFFNKVILVMNINTQIEDLNHVGTLLEAFKIMPRMDAINNLLTNDSVIKICETSKFVLKELILRGCFRLSNRVSTHGINMCWFLEKLEISNNSNIEDSAIGEIAKNCRNLKGLTLSNMKNVTQDSVKSISQNLAFLEFLDLSDDHKIQGDCFILLKHCDKLKSLILNGIELRDNDLVFTDYLKQLNTFSIQSNKKYLFNKF